MKRLKTLALLTFSLSFLAIGLYYFTKAEDRNWHGLEKQQDSYSHIAVPDNIEKKVAKKSHNHNHEHKEKEAPSRMPASIPPHEENVKLMNEPPKWKKDLASNVLRFSNPKTKVFIKELAKIKEHKVLGKQNLRHVIVKVQSEEGFVRSFEALVDGSSTVLKTWARTQVDPITTSRKKIDFSQI